MKRKTIYILLSVLAGLVLLYVVLGLLGRYENYQERKRKDRFEYEIFKALGLKFILIWDITGVIRLDNVLIQKNHYNEYNTSKL
jgi:hypothetical protein